LLEQLNESLQRTLPMARLDVVALPGCESLQLALINADFPTGPLPESVMRAVIGEPAYWAFCWGSGLALARWLLAHPEAVAGRRVVDFGAGSGVAGIAAARAGAAAVTAVDLDADARLACQVNAALNAVNIAVEPSIEGIGTGCDVILMADVLYDRSNFPLLDILEKLAPLFLVADSRVRELDRSGFTLVTEIEARTFPNLGEFDSYHRVRLFRHEQGAKHS
jgi:predicted nicotinamide N-methyase